jgi:hypothetical protein
MSRFESTSLNRLAAGAALAAALLAFAPASNAQEFSQGLEIAAGASYNSNDEGSDFDLSTLAVRYHYDWTENWGIEASYTNQDQDILEAELYEATVRFAFFQNEKVKVFAFAGGGWLSYDFGYLVGGDAYYFGSNDALALTSGIAAEISLGDRLYLRPDLRERFALDIFGPYDESSTELTLAVGYRL